MLDQSTFTIRRQVFRIFGAAFHVYDAQGRLIGYSSQKAFRLKEDIRIYADESRSQELLTIAARHIIDFSAAYDIVDAREGRKVGAARRRGWSSMVRDHWELLDADDRPVAEVREDSTALALLRRFLANLVPQTFHVSASTGRRQAEFRVHFNPFVYRMTVTIDPEATLDRRLLLGAAILLAAIEQRQR
jgi:hypothetical protein